jgi:NTE family protein
MALMQGGKRTATVTAARRSRLLALDKTSFNRVFLKNPRAIEYFARVLCRRLARVTLGENVQRSTTVIAVTKRSSNLNGASLISDALAWILKSVTNTKVLLIKTKLRMEGADPSVENLLEYDLASLSEDVKNKLFESKDGPTTLEIQARPGLGSETYEERASNLILNLSPYFRYLVIDLSTAVPELNVAAEHFSDIWIEVIEKYESHSKFNQSKTRIFKVINQFNPNSERIPISECEPFVIPEDPVFKDGGVKYILKHPRSRMALPFHRLARKITGTTIGLALGGGAAFGLSHLGVLKVLEKHHIPVDLIAGCSQGSIIGIGYAAGISVDEMISIARKLGHKRNFFVAMDFTLTGHGLLAGNRVPEIFTPYLNGKETFDDLLIPCKALATDIDSGESVAIGSGRLDQAFRASSSVPMIFAPLKKGERTLVDGGVSDPVPAEVVDAMGADICIAVNVVPPLKKGVQTFMSETFKGMNRMNPFSYFNRDANLPNMLDVVMNSLQVLQYELGNFKAISADVLINPDLSDFTWVEYYRADELIRKGMEAAERSLPAIEKILNEKLQAIRGEAE